VLNYDHIINVGTLGDSLWLVEKILQDSGPVTDQNWDTDSIKTLERDCVNVI